MPAVQFHVEVWFSIDIDGPLGFDAFNERRLPTLVQLMPQGLAWNYRDGSRLHSLLGGVAKIFARVDLFLAAVIRQFDPHTASFALDAWEKLLELSPGDLTLAERRLNVLAALRARGGQSGPYFKGLMESLGYQNVVITRLGDPFRCGDRIRRRMQGTDWRYAFVIKAKSIPGLDDLVKSAVGDGLRTTVVVHLLLT